MKAIAFVLAAAGTLASLSPALAVSPGNSLGECYNNLISWCNDNSNHPQACANTVMDACDELFASVAAGDLPLAAQPSSGSKRDDDTTPDRPTDPEPKPDPKPGRDSVASTTFKSN